MRIAINKKTLKIEYKVFGDNFHLNTIDTKKIIEIENNQLLFDNILVVKNMNTFKEKYLIIEMEV
jgi:hypothetical protein